jgi:WD40 repeat protein
MAKIFVSYSRKDSKTARKLIESFTTMGHDVWVDWEDIPPAVDWLEQIFRGIEGSEVFVFIVSPDSIKSEVCNVEIGRAAQNNKRIIPVVVRDVEPKTTNEIIRKLNWTFIRKGESLEDGLAKIKTAIELDLPWVEEHNRLQSRALEWHRKKDPSLLLRGKDLRNARHMVMTAGKKDPTPTELQQVYIHHSNRNDRRRTFLWSATVIAVLVMAFLSYAAIQQRELAIANEKLANQNREIAEEKARAAVKSEREARRAQLEAEEQQKIAQEQRSIAQAQRSAARAQIYQTQPGELYTSTLFALDSWQTAMIDEAGEILRKNISLLPIPVEQTHHSGNIRSLEFNSNGDLFITASVDGSACVWKVSDGTKQFCATSPKSVNDAVFSPDGKLIVTGDDSGLVQVIRVEDENIQYTFEYDGTTISHVDISGDGKQLAVTRDDGRITLIDMATGERKFDLQAYGRLRTTSFSPNGRYLAVGSASGSVTLFNLETGRIVSGARHKGEVLALTFSPDSRYLATGGMDGYAVVARTSDGQELYRLLNEDSVRDIAFAPNNTWFATVSNDRRIRIWSTTDGDERLRMSQNSLVQAVKVSANGQWLATTGLDKTVRVWNASTGAEMFQIPLKGDGSVLGFSKDGNYLVAGDSTGEINIWDISVMPVPESYLQFNGLARALQFSPSGDWLAASDDNQVWLLEPEQLSTLTGRPQGVPNFTLTGNVTKMVFSADSKWLGISTDTGNVILYSIESKFARTIKSTGSEYKLAFSPDGTQLITSGSTGLVETWDVANGTKIQTLFEEGSGIASIATSPNHIALGMMDKVLVLNAGAEQLVEINSPGDHQNLAFSADGVFLASSNSAGLIEIWKYENGEFTPGKSIRKEAVYALAFNPQSTQLAVGTTNNIYLINPNTVTETARIPQSGAVYGVSYSGDGNTLVTSSLKAIQFWDVLNGIETIEADNLVTAACSRLIMNFSYAQWSNLFDAEPYRLLCENLPVP